MSVYDDMEKLFGQSVRRHRKRLHVSQTRLAESMSGLGFPMHQTTLAKIERVARPILLSEALALSDLLCIDSTEWPEPPWISASWMTAAPSRYTRNEIEAGFIFRERFKR